MKITSLPLGKICDLIKGTSPIVKTVPGRYPLVTTGRDRKTADTFQFETEAVCIPLVSSTGHGHASLNRVHYQCGKFALGNILVAVIAKEPSVISIKFLERYLNHTKDRLIVPLMTGVANMSLSIDRLKTVPIEFPELLEQERIIKIMDEADALRGLRAQSDSRTAALIPALYHEMFGDPAQNPYSWPVVEVRDICEVKGGKRLPKGDDYSVEPTKYRYLRSKDVNQGWINESGLLFLKPETQQKISHYTVKSGDLVITIAGTIGTVAPVPPNLNGVNLTENAAKLIPRTRDRYNVVFLSELMQTANVKNQITLRTGQVTIGKLPLFQIEQISFPLPPLQLQDKFVARAIEIREIEAAQATSRNRMEALFQSLLHRAFNGAL